MRVSTLIRSLLCALFCLLLFASAHAQSSAPRKTRNVVFVMIDGFRWQELFRGAEADIINKKNGNVADAAAVRKAYWRDTAEARREALMPFIWKVVARQGQIFGNRDKGSDAYVTNGLNFSYPGYSETLCGFPDARVNSNDKIPNPSVTVLEWLERDRHFPGGIAAFGAWDVISAVFNPARSGLFVNAGYEPLTAAVPTGRMKFLDTLKSDLPHVWSDEPYDAITFYSALEYLREKKPRVLYLSLGETDVWAHERNYAMYLDAAHRTDHFLAVLWETLQSMPEYSGSTTLIFSPDHGRGTGPRKWIDHGEELPGSKYIWMAFLGPDTAALGERAGVPPVTQNQIAATLAEFLGEDYHSAVPKAGAPVSSVLPH